MKGYIICSNCGTKIELDETEYCQQLEELKRNLCSKCMNKEEVRRKL